MNRKPAPISRLVVRRTYQPITQPPLCPCSPISHYYPRTTNKITTASEDGIEISCRVLHMGEEAASMEEVQVRLSPMFPNAKWRLELIAPEGVF